MDILPLLSIYWSGELLASCAGRISGSYVIAVCQFVNTLLFIICSSSIYLNQLLLAHENWQLQILLHEARMYYVNNCIHILFYMDFFSSFIHSWVALGAIFRGSARLILIDGSLPMNLSEEARSICWRTFIGANQHSPSRLGATRGL